METLTILALYGFPVGAVSALGVWLLRSVFKDVSLSDTAPDAGKSAHRAEGLSFQLAIAEDLNADPATLNALQEQVAMAQEDAERDRQSEAQRQQLLVTRPVPWLSPVAAFHQIVPRKRPDNLPAN
ncbi:MAG: hypothetical protein SGJ27_09660 [Candidatus Melainabacteria bacterium]|nr:hypothetical protein [Candidatus Melainabacteria bacterium]